MTVEYANTANNNEIVKTFHKNDEFIDLTNASKFEIQLFDNENDPIDRNAAVLLRDTTAHASLFDITDIANGNITFKPDSTVMTVLTGDTYYARYVVFATDYPLGIPWGHDLFEISVRI